jgi:hypothetical protein
MYIIAASTRACSGQGQGKDVSSYVGGGGEHVSNNMDILHIVSIKTIPRIPCEESKKLQTIFLAKNCRGGLDRILY